MNDMKVKTEILRRIGWTSSINGKFVNYKMQTQVSKREIQAMSVREVIDLFVDDSSMTVSDKNYLLQGFEDYLKEETKAKVK